MKTKRTTLLILAISSAVSINAWSKVPSPSRNHQLARLSPRHFETNDVPTDQLSLSGPWKFSSMFREAMGTATSIPVDWQDIVVPGEWTLQGYDVDKDQAAGYARLFSVPQQWQGKRVKIRFDTVHSETELYVNGKAVGSYLGAFLPFEFDITDYVKVGRKDNLLMMSVKSESFADSLAKGSHYAKHDIGGILKDVHLLALPQVNVSQVVVQPELDADFKNASLDTALELMKESGGRVKHVEAKVLLRPLGIKVKGRFPEEGSFKPIKTVTLDILENMENMQFQVPVKHPSLWHAEHPFLYELQVELFIGGKQLETVTERIGFRKIEVRANEVYVNGAPVKLRGVCRHSVHPLLGRALPLELVDEDVRLFREANINFIRTSHYPPEERMLDLCDEAGIFVMNEVPVCWANMKDDALNQHEQDLYRFTQELIRRDRNHSCVLIWSQGNESVWGEIFEKSVQQLKETDPTRLVMFSHTEKEGVHGRGLIDIGTVHYPGYKGPQRFDSYFRPMLFDEALHLNAYNEREFATDPGVRDVWGKYIKGMWNDILVSRAPLGTAIWGGIDEIFFLPDGQHVGYGSWGIIDGWRRKKPEYWHTKKAYSPVRVLSDQITVSNGCLAVLLENRYDVASLAGVDILWRYHGQQGTVQSSLPAGGTGMLDIPLTRGMPKEGVLELSFYDLQGVLINIERISVGQTQKKTVIDRKPQGRVLLQQVADQWQVKTEGCTYTLDWKTGLFINVTFDNKTVVKGGPHLMILPVDNNKAKVKDNIPILERASAFNAAAFFSDTCTNWTCSALTVVEQADDLVKIKAEGAYSEAEGEFVYTFYGDGRFFVDYFFKVKDASQTINPRQIGIVFNVNGDCDTLAWKRKGIWNVYPQDHIGRLQGTTKAFYSDERCDAYGPRIQPDHSWSRDATPSGCNDFRSTKHNIYSAALYAPGQAGLELISDGRHHVRCWVDQEGIKMLAANFSNGGGEHYLRQHTVQDLKSLKVESKWNHYDCILSDFLSFRLLNRK